MPECEGCRRQWPLTDDGREHYTPGSPNVTPCSASPERKGERLASIYLSSRAPAPLGVNEMLEVLDRLETNDAITPRIAERFRRGVLVLENARAEYEKRWHQSYTV